MKKSYMDIESIKINNTDAVESVLVSNEEYLNVEIVGKTTEPFSYDLIVTFKNTSGAALASLEEGHYKGAIKKAGVGQFSIPKRIKLPKYLSKGTCVLDIVLHHPNVEYLLQCPNCATLYIDGNYDGFGTPLSLSDRGFCGLETAKID